MRRACSLAVFRRRLSSKPTATSAVATSSEAVTPATSDSNNEVETKTMLLKDAPTIRPPYYRKAHSYHEAKHMLQEEFPNEGDLTGAGARLDAYKAAEGQEQKWPKGALQPVLLQHFPLLRVDERPCSDVPDGDPNKLRPYRSKWEALSEESTNLLLKQLQPVAAFDGHSHRLCTRRWTRSDVTLRPFTEYTVNSFSWRNGRKPSLLLVSLSKEDDTEEPLVSRCDLPNEDLVVCVYCMSMVLLLGYLGQFLTLATIVERTGEIAASLINIAERIDFVSPYERPWTRFEKTWRRYITKTREDEQPLSDLYSGIVLPMQTYMDLAKESLRSHFTSTRFDSEAERVSACLSSLMDDAILCLAHNKPELADYRVVYEAQSESFWVRAGFEFLYDNQDLGSDEVTQKLRKLGQLAFVHRDRLAAMARSRKGMRDMLHKRGSDESTASVFPTAEDEQRVMYSPKVFNLWPDDQPLWQTPGYFVESDETHQHTVFAMKSLSGLRERIGKHWGMQGEEAEEAFADCAKAQAVASTFANLAATAHVQGFTKYNDVNRSYNAQLMLSDGREYFFAVGQLNTLVINVNIPGFSNPLSNAIRIEGPFKLFDSIEEGKFVTNGEEGLNKAVLERILQMIFKRYQK